MKEKKQEYEEASEKSVILIKEFDSEVSRLLEEKAEPKVSALLIQRSLLMEKFRVADSTAEKALT